LEPLSGNVQLFKKTSPKTADQGSIGDSNQLVCIERPIARDHFIESLKRLKNKFEVNNFVKNNIYVMGFSAQHF
jgi:hypothetical protein